MIFMNDLFYCLGGLCDSIHYANNKSMSEIDKSIDIAIMKLESVFYKAVTWFDDNSRQIPVTVLSQDHNITKIGIHMI